MKRIVFFAVLLLFLFIPDVTEATPYAPADSLLQGKALTTHGGKGPYLKATDGDLSTYENVQIHPTSSLHYTFNTPVEIDEFWVVRQLKKGVAVMFTMTDGSQVTYRILHDEPDMEHRVPVSLSKPVKQIALYSGYIHATELYEIDMRQKRDLIPPGQPVGLSAVPGFDQVELTWTANTEPDMAGYNVYRDGVKVNTSLITRTTYIVVGGDYNKVYNFHITAVDASGNESIASSKVQAKPIEPPDTTPPGRPMGLKATGELARIELEWTANTEPDLAGYLIYQNGVLLFTTPLKDTKFTVSGGLSYTSDTSFYIVAVDKSGNVSMASSTVTARPIKPADTTPPPVPGTLTARMSQDALSIEASWGESVASDLDGYFVYVSTDSVNFSRANAVPIQVRDYSITPVDGDTAYWLKVSAIDINGNESGFSNVVRIKTPSRNTTVNPGKPTADYWDISWTPVPGAVSYAIYYNNQKVGEVPGNVTTFRITKAMGYNPNGAIQVVDVRATFANGGTGGSNQPGKPVGSGWGMTPKDIITNSAFIIVSLSSLVLLGLVISIAPRLIKMLKKSINARRRAT